MLATVQVPKADMDVRQRQAKCPNLLAGRIRAVWLWLELRAAYLEADLHQGTAG
jgi:hypothetical protein